MLHGSESVSTFQDFRKFVPLEKVEESPSGLAIAYGVCTAEQVDLDGEICQFAGTVPYYKSWSDDARKATTNAGQEPSLGNVRLQHGLEIAGKVTQIDFDDVRKEIRVKAEAANSEISNMLRRGLLTGYSQGGKYVKRWHSECGTDIPKGSFCPICEKTVTVMYIASLAEVSLVDNPCLPSARYAYVKCDGSVELRKFHAEKAELRVEDIRTTGSVSEEAKVPIVMQEGVPFLRPQPDGKQPYVRVDGEDLPASSFLIVLDPNKPETWSMPWKFSNESTTRYHLIDAAARFDALTSGLSEDARKQARLNLERVAMEQGIGLAGKAAKTLMDRLESIDNGRLAAQRKLTEQLARLCE